MSAYPKMLLLFMQNQFQETIPSQTQLGRKFLDTLLYKITVIEMKNEVLYTQLKDNQKKTFNDVLQVFGIDHLLMCMGKIITTGQYDKIKQIQPELKQCILSRKIVPSSIGSSGYQAELNKTSDSSYNTSFTHFHIQKASSANRSLIQSSIPVRSQKQQQQQQQQSILQQLKKFEIKKSKLGEISLVKDQQSFSSYSDGNAGVIDAEYYLKTEVDCINSQINALQQKMKLNLTQWEQRDEYADGKIYRVLSRTCIIPERLPLHHQLKVTGQGRAVNIKSAKIQANRQILRQIYINFPYILNGFLKIKQKQNLKY